MKVTLGNVTIDPSTISKYNKLVPAVVGFVGQVVALGLISGSALHAVQIALAALTMLGVYLAPKNTS